MIAGCCKNWSLKLAVCLLVLRLQGRWTLAAECGVGTFKVSTRDGTICCKTCTRSRNNEPCPNADSLREECRCAQGYVCKGDPCDSCTKPTSCPEGQELIRTGSVDYLYICRKCSPGMHTVNGFCKPIIKPVPSATKMYTSIASTSSSSSLRYSNGVHQLNEKGASSSSIDGKRIENTGQIFSQCYNLALFTALVIFLLLLLSLFLHLLIWKMKAVKQIPNLEINQPSPMVMSSGPVEIADTLSCQYPEEEHGERTIEKDYLVYIYNNEKLKTMIDISE